jgi:hypothetical protein
MISPAHRGWTDGWMDVKPAQVKEISFKNRRVTIQIRRFHDNGEVEVTVRERLTLQKPDSHGEGILKLLPRWDGVLGDCVERK